MQEKGCSFFLTNHGEVIINTLSRTCELNLHSIRVHLSNVSHSTVYYITYPGPHGIVPSEIKSYAFKVMSDKKKFVNEINNLRSIQEKWKDSDKRFYYITDSSSLNFNLISTVRYALELTNKNVSYDWFSTVNNNLASSLAEIGVIIMLPALRKQDYLEDSNAVIFSELLASLRRAHSANILHCDLRSSNCLKFKDDGWQVVDFDLAVPIVHINEFGLKTGQCGLIAGSVQYSSVGNGVKKKIKNCDTDEKVVTVEWTTDDDVEMLQVTCNSMNN